MFSYLNASRSISEQLIPMFGLTKLHHVADPETTLDKLLFLINAIYSSDRLTTIISFTALFALIAMRSFKDRYKSIWWIYSLPEVFLVVVVSTGLFIFLNSRADHCLWHFSSVLSAQFKWEKLGLDILGSVKIKTGESLLEFPLNGSNIRYLRRTTSAAMSVWFPFCFWWLPYLSTTIVWYQWLASWTASLQPSITLHDLDTRLALTASWWRLELVTWQALLSLVPCQLLALSLGTVSVLV